MANSFDTEAFALLGVGLVVIGVRTYARIGAVGALHLAVDDYLMLLAAVIYGLETGAAYSVGARFHGLANNSMTPEQRATLSPSSEEYQLRVGGSKLQLIGWSLYTLLLWTLKFCICIYYSRMTAGIAYMRVRVKIGYFVIFVTYVTTISSILAGCGVQFEKNWQINPDPGTHCQPAISPVDCIVTVVLNIMTDFYLLSIPIPLLWKTQISRKQKAALIFVFGGAVFVMLAGILRCVLILTAGANGPEQAGSWAVRETFVAVVVANLPIIYSLLRGVVKKVSGHSYSSKRSRSKLSSEDHIRIRMETGVPAISSPEGRRSGGSQELPSAFTDTSSSAGPILSKVDEESNLGQDPTLNNEVTSKPLPAKPLPGPPSGKPDGQENNKRPAGIKVATSMIVTSEPASPVPGKKNSVDQCYEWQVSAKSGAHK